VGEEEALAKELGQLTDSQRLWVSAVISQFKLPHDFQRNPNSDWITEPVCSVSAMH
jgi:hypothetical protein